MRAKKTLCIIGAGGHGRVVADVAAAQKKYRRILFLDDGDVSCEGASVVGPTSLWRDLAEDRNIEFFVAIGNAQVRERFLREISDFGGRLATLIHPFSFIGSGVSIGEGSVVMAGAVVHHAARLGVGVIVNTCASVDHDCQIEDFCHVSVGAHVCGGVSVGSQTWIGAGATVIQGITVGSGVVIGAGAVVLRDIGEVGTYVGVPAKRLK